MWHHHVDGQSREELVRDLARAERTPLGVTPAPGAAAR